MTHAELHSIAERMVIPPRTLSQVKESLDAAKKRHADASMARLMLRHGRLTDEAVRYVRERYA